MVNSFAYLMVTDRCLQFCTYFQISRILSRMAGAETNGAGARFSWVRHWQSRPSPPGLRRSGSNSATGSICTPPPLARQPLNGRRHIERGPIARLPRRAERRRPVQGCTRLHNVGQPAGPIAIIALTAIYYHARHSRQRLCRTASDSVHIYLV